MGYQLRFLQQAQTFSNGTTHFLPFVGWGLVHNDIASSCGQMRTILAVNPISLI
jgi:Na+-driven multidrug efflux pump